MQSSFSSNPNAKFPDLAVNPGVESWVASVPAEGGAAAAAAGHETSKKKPWNAPRVFSDILNHRMLNFTSDEQEQWRALHAFHEQYTTAGDCSLVLCLCACIPAAHTPPSAHTDSVPILPIELQSPNGSKYAINHGSPLDWTAAWQTLAWRHDRPHKPSVASTSTAIVPSASTASSQAERRPTSLINGVTGGNASTSARAQGKKKEKVAAAANSLVGQPALELQRYQLRFAVTPNFEGEFSVGLVRIEEVNDTQVRAAWWYRTAKSHEWVNAPTFKPYMAGAGNRVDVQWIDKDTVLPVEVVLTKGSKGNFCHDAKSIAGQTARVEQACIAVLKGYITQHRSELWQRNDDASSDDGKEDDEDDVDEDDEQFSVHDSSDEDD